MTYIIEAFWTIISATVSWIKLSLSGKFNWRNLGIFHRVNVFSVKFIPLKDEFLYYVMAEMKINLFTERKSEIGVTIQTWLWLQIKRVVWWSGSLRASERNSVVLVSDTTQFNSLELLLRSLQLGTPNWVLCDCPLNKYI